MPQLGWDIGNISDNTKFDWSSMVGNVQRHIKSLNFDIRKVLTEVGVTYYNALAQIESEHKLKITYKNGKVQLLNVRYIVIATGGRPNMNSFEGCKEHCISSDDIFSLQTQPKRVLVVGAS